MKFFTHTSERVSLSVLILLFLVIVEPIFNPYPDAYSKLNSDSFTKKLLWRIGSGVELNTGTDVLLFKVLKLLITL